MFRDYKGDNILWDVKNHCLFLHAVSFLQSACPFSRVASNTCQTLFQDSQKMMPPPCFRTFVYQSRPNARIWQ
jgi:hypothetical protein